MTHDEWAIPTAEVEVTLGTGEIVMMPTWMANMREKVLAQRKQERLDYCAAKGIDPETYTGCPTCEQTGISRDNNLPCWCDYGVIRQRLADETEERKTKSLRSTLETR
jgi:hypothetical protein